ncbi:MAG: GntR family transcriptional regulator [Erysipelothrix sp.]|nr:GntR family transcriptional regulator [Erysipelothrix sp.]
MENYMDKVIAMIDLTQDKPLNEIIYEGLRKAIITGVIPMGERINEKNYAKALNVSRTPIRESLRRIQDEDIVRYVPNLGIVITNFTHEDVDEIYKIRLSLDILACVNAASLMNDEKEEEMRYLLEETYKAQKEGRVSDVIEMSKRFNSMIYDFAEMPRLKTIQNRLRDYLIRFRDISLTSDLRRQLALDDHQKIFDYMRSNNIDQMIELVTKHLYDSKKFIVLELEKQINAR